MGRSVLGPPRIAVAIVCGLLAGCATTPPSSSPMTQPLFAVAGAFVLVTGDQALPIYSTEDSVPVVAEVASGDPLQLLERGPSGRFHVQFTDPTEGSAFGWANV